ncbi:glutathione-dependent formaldehyde-activating enzyme [Xylariaceae sp. FL0594]|nr:glutathione-dependent formaldehyde-activating enzyme [Xylariaceae sp. FL0594]
MSALKTYRGNCHCASLVYEISLPATDKVTECNCSVCVKKGAVFVWPELSKITYVKGDPAKDLRDYRFNDGSWTHKFCPTCGVSVMLVGYMTKPKDGEEKEPDVAFNVRTFQHGQLDLWTIDSEVFDGASLPPVYEAPKYKGPEPTPTVDVGPDAKLYTGSCHCGAVTLALKSKPLDKDYGKRVTECNCSSCGRYGAIWAYPHTSQVAIEGKDKLSGYVFNNKGARKLFCKLCGVVLAQECVPLSEAELAEKEENFRRWFESAKDLTAVNLRVLNDESFDVKKSVEVERFDGYNFLKGSYVEP